MDLVFPASAGVIPLTYNDEHLPACLSRVSGGDPSGSLIIRIMHKSFPRQRG